MKILTKLLLSFAIIGLAVVFLSLASDDVQAANCTWQQSSGASWSTGANWQNGSAPSNGDDIFFLSGSAASTANINANFGKITINGYTGVITQAAHYSFTTFYQNTGTYSGVFPYVTGIYSSFIKTGGTYTTDCSILSILGPSTWSSNNAWNLYTLYVNSTLAINSNQGTYNLNVKNGCTITVASAKTLTVIHRNGWTYINNGIINGAGAIKFNIKDADRTITFGNINLAILNIWAESSATANRVVTLGADLTCPNTLLVLLSSHATYTMTLNLGGKSLSSNGIELSNARGGLVCTGSEIITNNGYWDSSGTSVIWTPATSTVNMNGNNYTIKLAAGQVFNKLNIVATTIAPKWIINNAGTQTVFWNITGLTASRPYNYYENYTKLSILSSSETGIIAQSDTAKGIVKYELRLIPLISGSPSLTLAELTTYSVGLTYDQVVLSTMTTYAPFLSFDGTTVLGTPTGLQSGAYNISIRAWNTNGQTYLNWTLTVNDTYTLAITGTPVLSLNETVVYSAAFACDRPVTWTLTTDAAWLSWDGAKISGTPDIDEAGEYDVSLYATGADGSAWVNYTITVGQMGADEYIAWFAPLFGIIMMVMIVGWITDMPGRWFKK